MHHDTAHIARRLADDASITDDEIIELAQTLRDTVLIAPVVEFERYQLLKVLETCAMLRSLPLRSNLGGSNGA